MTGRRLKDKITAMTPAGNTNQGVGMAWGWQSLSTTNGPIAAPAKADNYAYKDYIVLLSDGLNTQNRWSTSQSSIDDRQAKLCANIAADKTNPVTVFTIQVNINNRDALSEVLKDCATQGWQLPDDHEHHSDFGRVQEDPHADLQAARGEIIRITRKHEKARPFGRAFYLCKDAWRRGSTRAISAPA